MVRPRAVRRLHTRPPLDRMQQIFQAIKAGDFPSRIDLAGGIECTTKTIQRDIDFMRDRLKLPIAYDAEHKGYAFTQPVANFPMVELTEGELVSIFIAQKAVAACKGTPFQAPLESAFSKLVSGLDGRITVSWTDLDQGFSFRGIQAAPLDLEVFQTMAKGVRECLAVEFEYKKLDAGRYQKRMIEPYHLVSSGGQWYCIGWDTQRRAWRNFVLGRMKAPVCKAIPFNRSRKFSIKTYLKGSLGIFVGKGSHDIRLRFDAWAARLVRERIWHPSQTIQELTGGELELRLSLSSLEEIESWILSWGRHAKVLAPGELKSRIRSAARAMLDAYEDR